MRYGKPISDFLLKLLFSLALRFLQTNVPLLLPCSKLQPLFLSNIQTFHKIANSPARSHKEMPRYISVSDSDPSSTDSDSENESVNQVAPAHVCRRRVVIATQRRGPIRTGPSDFNVARIETLTRQIIDKVADVRRRVEEAKQLALRLCVTRDSLVEAVTMLQGLREESRELLSHLTRAP